MRDGRAFALHVLGGSYAICRLAPEDRAPAWATQGTFFSITRTAAELSIVCEIPSVPAGVLCERGWRVLAVQGPLDFNLTGVVAGLTGVLAAARISIFAVSTYDTDYLLVREGDLQRAIEALRAAGQSVSGPDESTGEGGRVV